MINQGFLAGFDFRYPKMAPPVGLEPTTLRLTAACSTDWAKEEYKCWHRSIFPGSHPPSIFDTDELNFCVRNGNRWILIASNTDFTLNWTRILFRTKITWSSPRPISIAKLNMSPYLHLQPINLVVFKGSYLLMQWDILSQERLHA